MESKELSVLCVPLQSLNAHVYILKSSAHQQDKAVQASLLVQLLHLEGKLEFLLMQSINRIKVLPCQQCCKSHEVPNQQECAPLPGGNR